MLASVVQVPLLIARGHVILTRSTRELLAFVIPDFGGATMVASLAIHVRPTATCALTASPARPVQRASSQTERAGARRALKMW